MRACGREGVGSLDSRTRAPNTCACCTYCVGVSYWAAGAAPVQACGNLPEHDGRKSYAVYADYVNYQHLYWLATNCGLAASTVKVAPPALDTCDVAFARFSNLGM
jgi:hypothetical protein